MVSISERPAEVADRAVPGHWESHLIDGAGHWSAVGTLAERSTRFVLLLHLLDNHTAPAVSETMRRGIGTLPSELTKSVIWDQRNEMVRHTYFTISAGVPVFFSIRTRPGNEV